jgi:hypothetical protein
MSWAMALTPALALALALIVTAIGCALGSVVVDADVEDDVELLSPPSVVIGSARLRIDIEVEDRMCLLRIGGVRGRNGGMNRETHELPVDTFLTTHSLPSSCALLGYDSAIMRPVLCIEGCGHANGAHSPAS